MKLEVTGLSEEKMLLQGINKQAGVAAALTAAKHIRSGLLDYQKAWLYVVTSWHNLPDANILEIGTLVGHSAAMIAQAAPKARILTLNPVIDEARIARRNLARYNNVRVLDVRSWDYHKTITDPYDLIFVDGDHRHIERDLPWFNRLKVGGLMLFQDYSPADASHACPPVYEALNRMAEKLHGFDVLIIDDGKTGMAGICRKEGESW